MKHPEIESARSSADVSRIRIIIQPNPFSEMATMRVEGLPGDTTLLVEVFSIWGRKVKSYEGTAADEITLEREGLPDGEYLYRVMREREEVAKGKFQVE